MEAGMETSQTALVLGASGGIGGEVAGRLLDTGWQVRALTRHVPIRRDDSALEWMRGDALVPADVQAAARGCSLIVHAVNPPGYRNWAAEVLPMLRNTMAAAKATGALILLPGTVYNYGPDAFPVAGEEAPQHPATRKGALRVRRVAELAAHSQRGRRARVVRSGD
jgi:nucleoside-diphosphate-sugar epimerase